MCQKSTSNYSTAIRFANIADRVSSIAFTIRDIYRDHRDLNILSLSWQS